MKQELSNTEHNIRGLLLWDKRRIPVLLKLQIERFDPSSLIIELSGRFQVSCRFF